MEFCLVDDKPFVINGPRYWGTPEDWFFLYPKNKFALEPLARYYCQSVLDRKGQIPTLKLQLIYPHPPCDGQKCRLQICNGDTINVLKRIKQWCGKDNVSVNLKLSQLNCIVGAGVDWFEAKDLPIKHVKESEDDYYEWYYDEPPPMEYGCELIDLNLPLQHNICGQLTVSVKIAQDTVDTLLLESFKKSNLADGNKRLLEDAVCSDLVIRAANGTEIKCHKGMLAVWSDVFKTMFENKMKESITSVVEMPDMSEQAVRAFLGFIYYGNRKEVSESCDLALELLVAADKYNVLDLLPAIAELITVMPNQWFNLDISMELLIFTERQQEICENKDLKRLQEKAIRVLKSHDVNSVDVLLNSEIYQQLLRNNPETAKQIHARFLSFALE